MRAAGGCGQLIQEFENKRTRVKLMSGEHRLVPSDCWATIGVLSALIIQIKNWEKLAEKMAGW